MESDIRDSPCILDEIPYLDIVIMLFGVDSA